MITTQYANMTFDTSPPGFWGHPTAAGMVFELCSNDFECFPTVAVHHRLCGTIAFKEY